MTNALRAIAPLLLLALVTHTAVAQDSPRREVARREVARRVVFLGDSITYSGQYIETIDAYFALRHPAEPVEFLNLGLPSETVSGLSEPGHAGGAFPRPDVHERLARVLDQTRPDQIVVCYGMNCGIYYPLAEERLEKFQTGLIKLRAAAQASGAKVLHVTPPVFDPLPIRDRTLPAGQKEYRQPFEGYNGVLDAYSKWLVGQRERGWQVADLHGPMNAFLAEQRLRDPKFTLAGDGVHMNATGHWLAAQAVLLELGADKKELEQAKSAEDLVSRYPHGIDVLKLVQQRQRLLKDAWLTSVGHKRPGMAKGLPLADAQSKAKELGEKITALTTKKR